MSKEPGLHKDAGEPSLPDKPSIAVLPFVNMSGDPQQDYLSDGITENLIADLSRISGLFVIASNSVFTYKGKAIKVEEVHRDLGVRYVLEGSVQKPTIASGSRRNSLTRSAVITFGANSMTEICRTSFYCKTTLQRKSSRHSG